MDFTIASVRVHLLNIQLSVSWQSLSQICHCHPYIFIITTNLKENLDMHSCLWEYHMSLISLCETTATLMNIRSY